MGGNRGLGAADGQLLGSVPGIIIGSYFAGRVPDLVLRPMLATVLAIVGVRLAF